MKRAPLVVVTLLLVAAPALAGPAGPVAVVCDQEIAPYRAFLQGLEEACGCAVLVIPPRTAAPPGLERRLAAGGVRAVVAVGLEARAAVEAVRALPVLLTMVPQVESWVAAGENRLGIEMALSPQRNLETLRRVFPRARRIGLVFDPAQTGGYVREAREAAAALQLTLVTREIAQPGELARRLAELRDRVDVIWLLPDRTVLQAENLNLLLLGSFESRVPLFGFARKYVELGAIAAAHLDPAALGAQAAAMVGRPSPAPAAGLAARREYARGAQLVLNQRVARKMGLVLDPALLESAADVIR